MEIKQYMQLLKDDSGWLPGKDAIEGAIKSCFNTTPHFISMKEMTAINKVLNGLFIYKDSNGYIRITTCGFTQILPNEYAFGQDRSGWGAELTAALRTSDKSKVRLCAKLLVQLAQYVNVRKTMFTEYSCVNLSRLKCREPVVRNTVSGIVFVNDVKLESIETVHGSVDFLQIVSVNNSDWGKIKKTPALVRQYIHEVKKNNPDYCIDQTENVNILVN